MGVNFAVSAARVQKRAASRATCNEVKRAAAVWRATYREHRENDLKQMGVVIPLSDWLGHNNGPDILSSTLFIERQWRKAQDEAFRPPSLELGRRWARMAEKLGLSYREFRIVMLEHGLHPTQEDATRIKALRAVQQGSRKCENAY